MSPHSNRSKSKPKAGREPSPEEVLKAREAAGLTQQAAADVIYTSIRNWQNWEQGHGDRRMPASAYELFMLKTGQYRRIGEPLSGQVELDNGAVIEVKEPSY